jgi:peptidase MA superfamily protein
VDDDQVRAARGLSLIAVVAVVVGSVLVATPAAVLAQEPAFGTSIANVPFGGPYLFRTSIRSAEQPRRVELLLGFPGIDAVSVVNADLTSSGDSWLAEATYTDHILPNSLLRYHFRVTDANGSQTDGPEASILTSDDRFKWQTVSGAIVRLHWNGASADLGRAALAIGEKAVDNAAKLLGVTETEPIDFFVYDDEQDFRDALGPGLRENVAGTAFAENRTMYAYLTPDQVGQEWARILVTHELTHLVFDTATRNIYRPAPHWLNEGIAVYLSEGFAERWQVALDGARAANRLIPLQGIVATFGAGDVRFDDGYAESVSAVDFFVRTYGEPKLWALIRSYSEGLSDDDAFRRATGLDLAGFNAAWMKSIGASVPPALGPQAGASAPPGGQGGPPPVRPGGPPSSGGQGPGIAGQFSTGSIVLAVAVLAVVVLVALRYARRQPAPPAMWPPSGGAYGEPPPAPLPPWRYQGELPQSPLPPDDSPSEPPSEWRP